MLISITQVGNDARVYLDNYAPPGTFRIQAISARYSSSGQSGARRVYTGVFTAANEPVMTSRGPTNQPANNARWYYCFPGAPYISNAGSGGSENWLPWPALYQVPPGGYVRVWDSEGISLTDSVLLHVAGD